MGRFMHSLIFVFLFTVLSTFLITSDGFTIKLIRRDKFDTDLFPGNLSDLEKYQIFADLSHSRALHLAEQARSRANLANPPINQSTRSMPMKDQLRPKLTRFTFSLFAVQVTIGSKPYPAYLMFDTGSDLTWVQCTKCKRCFPIKDGPFNPDDSKTYSRLPLNDGRCGKTDRSGSDKVFCRFVVDYSNDHVEGMTALENVRFMTAPGSYETIEKFVLGCAESASPGFEDLSKIDNRFAGIFGLGRLGVPDSFMEFTKERTKSKFSYCLPPLVKNQLETNLLFGDDVQRLPLPSSVKTIRIQTSPHYKVAVVDIAVDGKRLGQALPLDKDGTGGLLLDTGAVFDFLVTPAFDKVREAFIDNLKGKKVKPDDPNPLLKDYELCYSWPFPPGTKLPSLSFDFTGGTEFKIDFWNVFHKVTIHGRGERRSEKLCMSIMRKPEGLLSSTLGAVSMADYRFVYNLEKGYLSFYPETCRGN